MAIKRVLMVEGPDDEHVVKHIWQEEPGKSFGQAVSARYLDPSLPAADVFAAWLQRIFFS
jgi:hypothetical protein